MQPPLRHPVLLHFFTRRDTTLQVLERIRQARPPRLFLSSDGPRKDRPGEQERVEEVRRLVLAGVDWPCEVRTRFLEENAGAVAAVAGAVTWFFGEVEAGIILEDDCLPDPTFFPFCDELLEKYRDDPRVMSICGNQHLRGQRLGGNAKAHRNRPASEDGPDTPPQPGASYWFSTLSSEWGWATWRRAWNRYDFQMARWPEFRHRRRWLYQQCGRDLFIACRVHRMLDRIHAGDVKTWDWQFLFAHLAYEGLSIWPAENLVSNIGFGTRDAVNCGSREAGLAAIPAVPMAFPLRHPPEVKPDLAATVACHRFSYGDSANMSPALFVLRYLAVSLLEATPLYRPLKRWRQRRREAATAATPRIPS